MRKVLIILAAVSVILTSFGFYNRAEAMIPPPASHVWLFGVVGGFVFKIIGDVFGSKIELKTTPVTPQEIVVGQTQGSPVFGAHRIGNYAMSDNTQWNGIKSRVNQTVDRLQKYNLGCGLPADHNLNPENIPEGGIFYCNNGQPQTIGGGYSGKGTLIVEGASVFVMQNVTYENPATDMLGVIVLGAGGGGDINFNQGDRFVGAYFAENNINFNIKDANNVYRINNFKGLLAANRIKLPSLGTFRYDQKLALNPPPGFREIFSVLYQEAAP